MIYHSKQCEIPFIIFFYPLLTARHWAEQKGDLSDWQQCEKN